MSLYIWMALAAFHMNPPIYNWQYMGNFDSGAACHRAAESLGAKQYRCLMRMNGEAYAK